MDHKRTCAVRLSVLHRRSDSRTRDVLLYVRKWTYPAQRATRRAARDRGGHPNHNRLRFDTATTLNSGAPEREANMERVSSPKIADENIFVENQRNLNDPPMLSPMTESEFLRQRAVGNLTKELLKGTDESGSLIGSNSDLDAPQRQLTDPHVSRVPDYLTT